jgi:ABC-type Fe3+-hydroxamate transport system substrate-binding protein
MISLKDQLGRNVSLSARPVRIVSLVPSQTELLSSIGLEAEVVGITKFCVHPETWFREKTRIGGTKNPDIAKIKQLLPDLVLANKEENRKRDIDQIAKFCPVYVSDVNNFEQAAQMINDVGKLTGKGVETDKLVTEIESSVKNFPRCSGRVLYFIWNDPLMAAGPNTFIGHVLEKLGFENAVSDKNARYVELSENAVISLKPDILLLSSEPYPFNEKHREDLLQRIKSRAILVDGEMFSWYGSRMLKMAPYFHEHLQLQ